ncbi:MAG: hypothetical protein LBO72_05395 [Helicobacteraceae bacterium]|jgi:hypothetical protein|nr:hypothetical protein [Helicobacteraceae bacterium]
MSIYQRGAIGKANGMDESVNLIKAIFAETRLKELLTVDLVCVAPICAFVVCSEAQYYGVASVLLLFSLTVSPIVFAIAYIYHLVVYIKKSVKIAAINLPIYLINFLAVSYIVVINIPPA